MNLRDLEYADALARTRHFSDAAASCNISQSTLSIQIKKLEEELGTKLFERDSRQVLLTDNGRLLLAEMKHVLNAHRTLKEKAAALQNPLAGTLRFGAFPTLAPYLLPHIMPPLHAALPKVNFHLVEEKTETLTHQLLDGTLDAALIALPVNDARLDALPLFAESFLLAVAKTSPLAKQKRATLDVLKEQTLLLLDEGHCLRAQSLELCTRIGIGESQSYRATSLETLRHMVAADAGVTLIPALAAETGGSVAYLPFSGEVPERIIALVFRSATGRRPLFGALARSIRATAKGQPGLKPLAVGRNISNDAANE
jgi:LysR family hydrogen peroxide-inducible transcriptional activator